MALKGKHPVAQQWWFRLRTGLSNACRKEAMPTPSTLTTARLRLRSMRLQDWKPYSGFMGSGRSRQMGGPFAARAAWGMFCADHVQWRFFGAVAPMIDERASGPCIGQVGINSGPAFPEQEIGRLVFAGFEGQAYGLEAAVALRDWARDVRCLPTLVSYVDPEDVRSRRLSERLGARLDDAAPRADPTDLVYRHFG